MAETTKALTLENRPISDYLSGSFDRLKAGIPSGRKGQAMAGVTLQGVEFGLAWQPRTDLSLTGYAGRLWGGTWEAGAKLAYTW